MLRLRRAEIALSTPHVDWIEFTTFGAYHYPTPEDYFAAVNTMDAKTEAKTLKDLITTLKTSGLPTNAAHDAVEELDVDMTAETQSETHATFATRTIREAQINDGTVRITMLLKPKEFANWSDEDAWYTFDALLRDLMDHHPDQVKIYPWKNESALPILDSSIISQDPAPKLETYLAAPVLRVQDKSTFIAVIRAAIPMSASALLRPVKTLMDETGLSLRISNSTSAGGDIVYAGDIYFKHPTHTHRYHYLKHLQSTLPENTPHFDLNISPGRNGEPPKLKIMCGKNHLSVLSEILTAHLNGKKTTEYFLSHILAKKTSQQELDRIISKQRHFLETSVTIPVPMLTNLDLVRTERFPTGKTIQRTLRGWARQLKDTRGNSLYCDVDKGKGKVVLICPQASQSAAEIALQQYRERLKEANTTHSVYDNLPVPTNIFLQDMVSDSSHNPWFPKASPSTPASAPNPRSYLDFPPLRTPRPSGLAPPSRPPPPTATVDSSVTFETKIQELQQSYQNSFTALQEQLTALRIQLESAIKDQDTKVEERFERHRNELAMAITTQKTDMDFVIQQLKQIAANQNVSQHDSPVHKRQRSPANQGPLTPSTQLFSPSYDAISPGQNTPPSERDGQQLL
jgi:hypothetical protein